VTRTMLIGCLAWPWEPTPSDYQYDGITNRPKRQPAMIPTGTVVVATHGKSVVEYRGELFTVNPEFVSDATID
jgi:hypothetical protein